MCVCTKLGCKVFPAELRPRRPTNWRCFLLSLPSLPLPLLLLVARPGESFIDEIVNTPDRRMFCRPFGRLSVAIGDHPMRPRLLNTVQKGLKLVANRSLSLPHYLNLTFSFLIRPLPLRFAPLPLLISFLRCTKIRRTGYGWIRRLIIHISLSPPPISNRPSASTRMIHGPVP